MQYDKTNDIIINARPRGVAGPVIDGTTYQKMAEVCLKILNGLGELGLVIESIRVDWTRYAALDTPWPTFTFMFTALCGTSEPFEVNLPRLGVRNVLSATTSDEIASNLLEKDCLHTAISNHLKMCHGQLAVATRLLTELTGGSDDPGSAKDSTV